MKENVVPRSLAFSLVGHAVFFSIMSFSLGARIARPDFAQAYFLGAFLRHAEVRAPSQAPVLFDKPNAFVAGSWLLPARAGNALFPAEYFVKPAATLGPAFDKLTFEMPASFDKLVPRRKEMVVMFYPQLPYHFLLYFKDRQVAHLELQFLISSYEQSNSVIIRRKISSGNLEVDLLSMRYLDHYLSMQLGRFPLNQWQTVKIDFRPTNE